MKEQLQRQIGPFKLWQWLLIVIVGVGLGLIIRNRFNTGSSGETRPTTPAVGDDVERLPATQGAPTILQQDFDSVRSIREEQDRLADELDSREETLFKRQDEFFTDIRKRISEINIPVEMPEVKQPTSKPSSKPKPSSDPLEGLKQSVINAYHTEGVKPPNSRTVARIAREVQQGRSLQDLRSSIRNNERRQGRGSASESREYWSSKGYQF